jgi:uncharacterized protein
LRLAFMLLIDIPRIPPEGLDLDEGLDPESVHLEPDDGFTLDPGGRLRGRVEVVDEATVHVRGHLVARLHPQCGRCLARYPFPLEQELDLFYLPREKDRKAKAEEEEEGVELTDRDVVVGYYDGESLDLGAVVREQLFLALPMKRLCREDCQGLCPTCGKDRNTERCACPPPEEPVDPRLLPLRQIFTKKGH